MSTGSSLAWLALTGLIVAACGSRTPLFDLASGGPCGNGTLDPGEECDDGNRSDTDRCTASCKKARCGDAIVWAGVETCDGTAGCAAACGPLTCGDGIVQPPEQCDDGNADDTDACLSSCVLAFCGDGSVEVGKEACDDDTPACITCELCGDGKKRGAEECDEGPANADRPAFRVSQPSTRAFGTNALVRKEPASAFYGYSSASSHTGFEATSESRTYLYVDGTSGKLSLFVTHGEDEAQSVSQVRMEISGIPPGFTIEVADDDADEFFQSSPTTVTGHWNFHSNSDGGVIGGLPFPGMWTITIVPHFIQGISKWGFVEADLSRVALSLDEPLTIEAFDSTGTCRLDCTAPRCGDGRLDGGEVCDDGNTTGGDGCAADCHALD